jgi:hypothetical protein
MRRFLLTLFTLINRRVHTRLSGAGFLLGLLCVTCCSGAWCEPGIIDFAAYPPSALGEKLMGDHAWAIYATGEIDADAGQRLDALIAEKHIPNLSHLYLHSPGGNLLGGIALGRVIRAHQLQTDVGQFGAGKLYTTVPRPGYCYSACAVAFLGGEYRFLLNGSVYGVHRFFWKEHTQSDADLAQILSAAVVDYMQSMGVSTELFSLASQAGPDQVVTPTPDKLLALGVINNGRKPVAWSIESVTGAIYLKGQQETSFGINKFLLVCPAQGPMQLWAIFDAGQNTDEVLKWGTHWLFVDGQQLQIQDHLAMEDVKNGWINLTYTVDDRLLSTVVAARSYIGIGLSPAPGAAIFEGFDRMPFDGAVAKLSGFLQVCRH